MAIWASSKGKNKNPRIHNSNGPDFFPYPCLIKHENYI